MVTLMVPDCPAASTSGLKVDVPKVRSAQTSPLSAETPGSKGCIKTRAAVLTGAVGAPAAPKGPISAGITSQGPNGTSGTLSIAATVSGATGCANKSGASVALSGPKPTRKRPEFGYASMLMGTVDWATKSTRLTSVGTKICAQPPGSDVVAHKGDGCGDSVNIAGVLRRPSAK